MPGLRLIEPVGRKAPSWFTAIPRAFQPTSHQWLLLPLTALFGSEELSNQSPAIVERISEPFLSLHPSDGARLSLDDQTTIELTLQGTMYRLAVRLEPSTPAGTAGISLGPDVSDVRVPVWIDLFKAIKAGHRRRVAWLIGATPHWRSESCSVACWRWLECWFGSNVDCWASGRSGTAPTVSGLAESCNPLRIWSRSSRKKTGFRPLRIRRSSCWHRPSSWLPPWCPSRSCQSLPALWSPISTWGSCSFWPCRALRPTASSSEGGPPTASLHFSAAFGRSRSCWAMKSSWGCPSWARCCWLGRST